MDKNVIRIDENLKVIQSDITDAFKLFILSIDSGVYEMYIEKHSFTYLNKGNVILQTNKQTENLNELGCLFIEGDQLIKITTANNEKCELFIATSR